MSSWLATVDTPQVVVVAGRDAPDVLLAFSDALDDILGGTGSSASVNAASGVLSATFTIDGSTVQEATDAAVNLFNATLERIGLPTGNVVHLDVEPMEDRAPVPA